MAGETTSELIVRMRPEGMDEVQDQLADVGEQFEETTDTAADASEQLTEFSERMEGAMQVVGVALAAAATGLLSTVPVIGEAANGLFAIIDAIGLKIDQLLRQLGAGGLTGGLFGVADAIMQTQGIWGDFIGLVSTVGATLGILEGAVMALNTAFGLSLTGPLSAIVAFLGGPLTAAIAGIIATISALGIAWATNFLGIKDKTKAVVSFLLDAISSFISNAGKILMNYAANTIKGFGKLFSALKQLTQTGLNAVLSLIGSFGKQGLNSFIKFVFGMVELVDKMKVRVKTAFETLFDLVMASLKRFGNTILSEFANIINGFIDQIPKRVRKTLNIEKTTVGESFDPRSTEDILASAEQQIAAGDRAATRRRKARVSETNKQLGQLIAAMQNTDIGIELNLDSRRLAESTEELLGREPANAGRTGTR